MAGPYSTDSDVPNLVTIGDDGLVRDSDGDVVVCSWTAACEDDATGVQPHPILGGVPVCDRHAAWIDKLKAGN